MSAGGGVSTAFAEAAVEDSFFSRGALSLGSLSGMVVRYDWRGICEGLR